MLSCYQCYTTVLAVTRFRDGINHIPVQSFSTFGHVWNNSLTSHYGRLEASSSRFELAWKPVVFRVFLAVFACYLVIQQQRWNGRRLVQKMTNHGFEILEKARFFFSCIVSILRVLLNNKSFPFWNISREKFFQVLKISSGYSRGFLVVSCETWRWATVLLDGPREFFVKQSSVAKWLPSKRLANKRCLKFWTISSVFSQLHSLNKHYTTTANSNGRSVLYWPFTCYLWKYFTYCSEKPEGVGSVVDWLDDFHLMLKHWVKQVNYAVRDS